LEKAQIKKTRNDHFIKASSSKLEVICSYNVFPTLSRKKINS